MINIENRGKNLIDYNTDFPTKNGIGGYSYYGNGLWYNNGFEGGHAIPNYGSLMYRVVTKNFSLKPNTNYTLEFDLKHIEPSSVSKSLYGVYINSVIGQGVSASVIESIYYVNYITEGHKTYTFTSFENSNNIQLKFDFYRTHGFISNIMLYEGTEDREYTPPKQDNLQLNTELFGYNGIFDEYLGNGKVLKRWGRLKITGVESDLYYYNMSIDYIRVYIPNITYYNMKQKDNSNVCFKYNGNLLKPQEFNYIDEGDMCGTANTSWFITIFNKDGGWTESQILNDEDIKRYFNGWKYIDGTTWQGIGSSSTANATTSLNNTILDIDPNAEWKPYELIYLFATPTIEDVEVRDTIGDLTNEDNYFIHNNINKVSYIANGVTTNFSSGSITSFEVYINGISRATDDIEYSYTKTTSNITFDKAPKNGTIIEIVSKENNQFTFLTFEALEPQGTEYEISLVHGLESLNINKKTKSKNYTNYDNTRERDVIEETYEINLTDRDLQNIETVYEDWKDKIFNMHLIDEDSKETILVNCKILDYSQNKFNSTYNLRIEATDIYVI